MQSIIRHITKCLVAGIVALLPIFGAIFSIWYIEDTIAAPWLEKQGFYFPGLGLIFVAVIVYLLGLTVSTFVGRWLWKTMDRTLDRLPILGTLYQTLKQLVGYGSGDDAIFREVVLVNSPHTKGEEIGLITNTISNAQGQERIVVFIPGSPNPTTGRLLVTTRDQVHAIDMKVSDVMQSLVSVGATPIQLDHK